MREQWVDTDALTLSALTSEHDIGAMEAPIIALHGWLDNAASLVPVLERLPATTHWIALDLPGHGHSQHRPTGAPYYFTEWVADLISLITRYDFQRVHLVGHSMGGFISQILAAVIPERIAKVTLIEAFGLLTYNENETLEKLRGAMTARQALAAKEPPVYQDIERLVKVRAELNQLRPEQIKAVVLRNLMPAEGGFAWRIDPRVRLGSPFRYTAGQARDILAGLTMPVKLIRGTKGFKDLDTALTHWRELVPQLEEHMLEGGHHVHLEQPIAVAEQIAI